MLDNSTLDQIIGVKQNLEGGFGPGTPLRKFKGKLEEIATEDVPFKNGKTGIRLIFKLTDVEVLAAEEPYDFPIAEVKMLYFASAQSGFGVFYNSYLKLAPAGVLAEAIGKVLEVAWTGGHQIYDSREGKATPQDAWEVLSIEGVETGPVQSAYDRAIDVLDGKTVQQFNTAVLAEPLVRSDAVVQASIIGKKFLPDILAKGLVSIDANGVYHKA